MIDAQSESILRQLYASESRSLLQYVQDAFPWTTTEQQEAYERFRQIMVEDSAAIRSLAEFLTRRHRPLPWLPMYPAQYTSINFVSLKAIIPLVLADVQRSLRECESLVSRIQDAEARSLVYNLIEMKRRHLESLLTLSISDPNAA